MPRTVFALSALLVALVAGRGTDVHRPRTAFMQTVEEGASMREMSLERKALERAGLASEGTASLEAALGRAGLTLETRRATKSSCIFLFAVLVFSCGCLGGSGHSEDDGSASQMAGTLVPLGVLCYIVLGTDIIQQGLAGEKMSIWCALLCVWSIGQLACGCALLCGLFVLYETHSHVQESLRPKDPDLSYEDQKRTDEITRKSDEESAPLDAQNEADSQRWLDEPCKSIRPDPTEPPAPPEVRRDDSLTEEQFLMVSNVMARTGAAQEAAVKALMKNNWHGSRAVKALQAKTK